MNVVCVTHAYPRWDGDVAGAFIERLVRALARRGHGIRVIAPADAGRGGREVRHQIPVTRVRYAPAARETLAYRGTMLAAARSPLGLAAAASLVARQSVAIARLCRDGEVDLVHAHWWLPAGLSAWLTRPRRRYLVSLHGSDVTLLDRSAAARALARRVLKRAAAVTAASSFLAERAARVTGLDPARILVQPMPVDSARFTRASRGGGGVVTVGRLSRQKRLDLLLEAMADLQRHGRGLPLTVVGDGEERPALERRAAELALAPAPRFLGALPPEDVAEALGDADVFAFPALREGFGLAAAEALMLGIPVVATRDGGGVTDIVPPEGAGRLVPPGDARALARAIDEVAHDALAPRLAAQLGAELRRRLEADTVAGRFEAIFRDAVAARAA